MRAFGIDISRWQLGFKPRGNLDFIIQRASIGVQEDPLFKAMLPNVRSIERRGAYHAFVPWIDWQAQADLFLELIEQTGFKWLALDYEIDPFTKAAADDAMRFIEYCQKQRPALKVLIYTRANIYRDSLQAFSDKWDQVELWIARYPKKYNDTDEPKMLGAREDWTFWQYSAKGNKQGKTYGVLSEDVDLDVFNGTIQDLDQWLGGDPVVDPCRKQTIEECIRALEELL